MQVYDVKGSDDVISARHFVRDIAKNLGFGLVDQTRLTTVASELVRNIANYAGSGKIIVNQISNGIDNGIKIEFKDNGPGIGNIELAMKDGYTTSGGLGSGLPGSKRLVDEFFIESEIGRGTTITITKNQAN